MANDNELVTISSNTQLSFHQLQDIYHSLTGRFERISQQFTKPYIIRFEDIEQLHARINQCCDSYGAKVKNESITVYHVLSTKEEFSSFNRFRIYNRSNTAPVENISIEYNILIIPAGTQKAVQYRIRLNLISRSGLRTKDMSMFVGPVDFLKLLGRPDGYVSVEYADYAAAKHFLTQINEWYEALEFSAERKWLSKIQSISHWFRQIVPTTLIFFMLLTVAYFYESWPKGDLSNGVIAALSRIAALAVVVWMIGVLLGRFIEYAVDRIQPVSSVIINRGDERAVEKWRKSNILNAFIAFLGVFFTILINILSNYIYAVFLLT